MRAAARVATGRGRNPRRELERIGPEVVHVHNMFPNYGRRWVGAFGVPLVHTIHNYRPLCANALLLKDGRPCTRCPDGDRWAGVRYACYRGSRAATLPLAWANRQGPAADPLLAGADHLVFISELQRKLFRNAGAPPTPTSIWPNFLPQQLDPGSSETTAGEAWIFVGRLSQEKGALRLLRLWPHSRRLRVVGDGPERPRVEAAAGPNVEVLGSRSREEVVDLLRGSAGLVFPSACYEASSTPLVYVEALAAGVPVVALPPSPVGESIRRDGTGVAVEADDGFAAALEYAEEHQTAFRRRCREVFEAHHTEEAYVRRAVSLYTSVAASRSGDVM